MRLRIADWRLIEVEDSRLMIEVEDGRLMIEVEDSRPTIQQTSARCAEGIMEKVRDGTVPNRSYTARNKQSVEAVAPKRSVDTIPTPRHAIGQTSSPPQRRPA